MSHTGRGMGGVAGRLLGCFGWRLTLLKQPILFVVSSIRCPKMAANS